MKARNASRGRWRTIIHDFLRIDNRLFRVRQHFFVRHFIRQQLCDMFLRVVSCISISFKVLASDLTSPNVGEIPELGTVTAGNDSRLVNRMSGIGVTHN